MAIFKTTITIVGVGKRLQGKSKNGKDYDMHPLSFTYPDPYNSTDGFLAGSAPLNHAVFEQHEPLYPGDELEVVLSTYQGKTNIATVL